jgi:hypothetical protein
MRGNLALPFLLLGGSIALAQSAGTFTPAGQDDRVTGAAHYDLLLNGRVLIAGRDSPTTRGTGLCSGPARNSTILPRHVHAGCRRSDADDRWRVETIADSTDNGRLARGFLEPLW